MNNQLDKFFRDRLGSIALEPGSQVWSRIEKRTVKKNRTIVWYRVAAVFCLVSLVGTWMYVSRDSSVSQELSKIENLNLTQESKETIPAGDERSNLTSNQNHEEKKSSSKSKEDVIKKKSGSKEIEKKNIDSISFDDEPSIASSIAPASIDDIVAPKVETSAESKSIVIVYELKPIPQRQTNESQFVTLPEKKSGIKKVLEIAGDVRSGDSMLNGLRQTKDEILAFNFRKEDKSNND